MHGEQAFKKDFLSADFIVPMGPGVAEKIKDVTWAKTGSKIIDPKFNSISGQYKAEKYELVLNRIKKDLEKK